MPSGRAEPLATPGSPGLASPGLRRVRKRVSLVGAPNIYDGSYYDDSNAKYQRHPTLALGLRNFVLTLLMMSFPIGIFLLPILLRSANYPRVVVSLTTTPQRLPFIRQTLESLLYDQSLNPAAVYLVLPEQSYATKETLVYDPYPEFIDQLILKTQLEVLRATWDYGPISKVLYALEKEQGNIDTRIVYVDDDIQYDGTLVQTLVDASLQFPSSVVALSGGTLRNKFRQIKHTHLKFDKFPNLFMYVSGTPTYPGLLRADIVQGFTGVCLRPHLLPLELFYQILQDTDVPSAVVKSDDVVLSAMMEHQNVTRWIVPGGPNANIKFTNSSKVNPLATGMHQNLIQSTHYLQQKLHIWSQFSFLDWTTLTQAQIEAIHCEAAHEQECSSDVCLPNAEQCPEAQSILQEMSRG